MKILKLTAIFIHFFLIAACLSNEIRSTDEVKLLMSQDPDVAAYQSSNAIVISYVFKYNNQKFKEFNEISLKFKDGSIKPANELEVEAKKYTEAME